MLFNSISFAIFLPIVFILYWFFTKNNIRIQNLLLLASSYYFYSCWDYRFLFLLIFSTFLDYYSGIQIHRAKTIDSRKFWFWLSIIINLGFLGVFKYFNFFSASFSDLLLKMGLHTNPLSLNVILPIGISFYTFHGLSYVIDIYNRKIEPELNFVDYSVFVSFFPLLVAGPIERATHLLPQIQKVRVFDINTASEGLKQILWGLFKKIVIADNCATFANLIFNNYEDYNGSTLVLGAIFFTFQIYCDFSGYSDIALGTAKLFGITLLKNFAFPYFSRDIAEFWRRWHISLSSWFRDYVYIPLGGSKVDLWVKVRNTFIIFLISGFWHGANWTFIFWGLLNAFYFLPSLLLQRNRVNIDIVAQGKILPSIKDIYSMTITFSLTVFAWIFFRAESLTHAFNYINKLFSVTLFKSPIFEGIGLAIPLFFLIVFFIIIEWIGRENEFPIQRLFKNKSMIFRWVFYFLLICTILIFSGEEQQFIYFQF